MLVPYKFCYVFYVNVIVTNDNYDTDADYIYIGFVFYFDWCFCGRMHGLITTFAFKTQMSVTCCALNDFLIYFFLPEYLVKLNANFIKANECK